MKGFSDDKQIMGAALYRLAGLSACFGGCGGCMDCFRSWVSSGASDLRSLRGRGERRIRTSCARLSDGSPRCHHAVRQSTRGTSTRQGRDGSPGNCQKPCRRDISRRGGADGGNPNGDVTLVEFFDYNCPYCRQVSSVMTKAEEAD